MKNLMKLNNCFCYSIKSAISFVLLISAVSVSAQQKVVLHEVVGDTIDLVEKIDYVLFTEIEDSLYDYGVVFKDNELYVLEVTHNSGITSLELCPEVFHNYAGNVEKLSAYYRQKKEKNNVLSESSPLITKDSIPLGLDIEWMSKSQKDKMTKESRRYNRLKLDADEMGLMGFERKKYIETGGRMEFPLSK
jgi:hypothetical protein